MRDCANNEWRLQERITLTEANMSSWLRGSSVVHETRSLLDESQVQDVNDSIQVRVGDVLWLYRRPRTIVVSSLLSLPSANVKQLVGWFNASRSNKTSVIGVSKSKR